MAGELGGAGIDRLINAVSEVNSSISDQAEDMRKLYSGRGGRGGREQRQVEGIEHIKSAKKVADVYNELYMTVAKLNAETANGQAAQTNTLVQFSELKEQLLEMEEVSNDVKDEFDQLADELGDTTRTTAQFQASLENAKVASVEQASASEQLVRDQISLTQNTDKMGRAFDRVYDVSKDMVKGFFSFKTAMASAVAGVKGSFTEIEFALKHQAESYALTSKAGESSALALSLGPMEMQNLVSTNRQLMNAAASDFSSSSDAVRESTNIFKMKGAQDQSLYEKAYDLTGNFNDAANLMMNTMGILSSVGVDTNAAGMTSGIDKLMDDFAGLSRVTGQSSEAIQQQVAEYFASSELQTELMNMTEKERRQKVLAVGEMMKGNVMMGKTTQSALEASKALSSLKGKGAKDRMKEAAKLQAVAGALGLGFGGELAELMRKPSLSPEEQDRQRELMDQMAQTITAAKKEGGGKAMAVEAVTGKLDADTLNAIMLQNTEMDAGMKISKDAYDEAAKQTPILEGMSGIIKEGKQLWDKYIGGIMKDPTALLILSGIQGLGSILTTIATTLAISKLFGGTSAASSAGMLKGLGGWFTNLGSKFALSIGALGGRVVGIVTSLSGMLGKIFASLPGLIKGAFNGTQAMLGKVVKSVPAMGKSLVKLAPKLLKVGGGVALAAGVGWEIGTAISDTWEKNDPEGKREFNNSLGKSIDSMLAWFGNDDAKERLTAMEKKEERLENEAAEKAKDAETQTKMLENLEKQTTAVEKTAKETTKTNVAIDNQTQLQKDAAEKQLESETDNARKSKLKETYRRAR